MKKLKTIFLGTPDFAVATLELLHHHPSIEIVSVVSMPDRPAGRGQELKSPEVINYAKAQKIKFIQTDNINKELETLKEWGRQEVDLIIVLAFAQFLGLSVLTLPKIGCFNIHTSLLPKYRGAAPIQYALWNGDSETGVSIQRMVKKMDAGNIVHEHLVPIASYETAGMLTTRLKFQAALACNDFLQKVLGNKLSETIQDESKVSFAPTLNKEDGHLLFLNFTSKEIFNRFRAMHPWPGSFCYLSGKRLKVISLELSDVKVKAGEVINYHNTLIAGCKDGSVRLSLVQLEGKKVTPDTELLNGWRGELVLTNSTKGQS